MKGVIYIGSTGPGSGRSLLGWSLAEGLLRKGIRTGLVHFGPNPPEEPGSPVRDPDGDLFTKVLGEADTRVLCPPREEGAPSDRLSGFSLDGICEDLRAWGTRRDCLLLLGSQRAFSDRPVFPVSEVDLARRLQADVFLLDRFEGEASSVYSLLSIQSLLRGLTRCVIVNRIPAAHYEREKARMRPFLEKQPGTPAAFVPEMTFLGTLTVEEIARRLPADIVAGRIHAGRRISGCSLGTAFLQGPLRLFRHSYGRIVLSCPPPDGLVDETHPAEESVAAVLLPGSRAPNPLMVEAATRASVSLLACSGDTLTTLETLHHILGAVRWEDRPKQELFSRRLLLELGVADILDCAPRRWK